MPRFYCGPLAARRVENHHRTTAGVGGRQGYDHPGLNSFSARDNLVDDTPQCSCSRAFMPQTSAKIDCRQRAPIYVEELSNPSRAQRRMSGPAALSYWLIVSPGTIAANDVCLRDTAPGLLAKRVRRAGNVPPANHRNGRGLAIVIE
jgi:hypothetical protein